MALPVVTSVTVPFPAGVEAVTLTGALLGVQLGAGQTAPEAVLGVLVAADQATPADYQPVVVNNAPGDAYSRPLAIPIGSGAYFPIPLSAQNLPAKIQLQVQNAGENLSVNIITSS